MNNRLGGYWLKEPRLRFDYEDRNALSDKAYEGLRAMGPYDLAEQRKLGRKDVRTVFIGRADKMEAMVAAIAALEKRRMGKLHDVFQIRTVDQLAVPATDHRNEASAYRDAVRSWLLKNNRPEVDLAFVLHDDEESYRLRARGASPYYATKAAMLLAGVPTQSICYKNLVTAKLQTFESYFVPNILTACYAKLGGKPWVIQDDQIGRPEITIGVATSAIFSEGVAAPERLIGISTIFKENGAFALWDITPLHQSWEAYEEALQKSIVQAINSYEAMERQTVSRIACHVSGKRTGRREISAIKNALSEFKGRTISADLVHINDDAMLWLFDGRDNTHRPEQGFLAQLTNDGRSALLHTEGRNARKFPTRPLKLAVHGALPHAGCHDVYQHLYDLRWMSWRGVATASRPVSVDYPARMARLLAQLHQQEEVDAISILPKLTTKAWFL
jgi:hypothetical protein